MSILGDLKMYGRFALGLRGFLRRTIALEEARATIRQRLADRETSFLRLVERGIFGYPRSPYLSLLKMAGCEMGDIQNMVRARGLENTLRTLREAGVYVGFEEFKGRQPIVRNGKALSVKTCDFDNPYLTQYYSGRSGGTTGAGTRVVVDLDHLADGAQTLMIAFDAHGVLHAPTALWRGILPETGGINNILRGARFGNVPQKWFSPIRNRDVRAALKYRLSTNLFIALGRFLNVPIPRPEPVSLDQANVVARWAAETLKIHNSCLIRTGVSMAMRVCVAAKNDGLDLTGAVFLGGGEPPTPAKVREICCTGARWIPNYTLTEAGRIGVGCARPLDENDLHLFMDRVALIQFPHHIPGFDIVVPAFHFTTLLPSAPKIMLNVESDDYGVIEDRSCGCPLEAYGFTKHLRHIYSFSKLTGEGVTLVGSEMITILEEVLPGRFGGTPLDYQLLEEEDHNGFTKLSLFVSPRINIADEKALIDTVLEALRRSSVAADLARAYWTQAGMLQVKRMEPFTTARCKLMPLHIAKRFSVKGEHGNA